MTVFVPLTYLIPWDSWPNLLAKDLSQIFLSRPLIRCLYSWANPEIWCVTEFAPRGVWPWAGNAYRGWIFLFLLGLKLELGPPMSTLGGCAVFTFGDGIWTSGGIVCGPDGDLWILCWKFDGLTPSSSWMALGCGVGVYSGRPGCGICGIITAMWSACLYEGSFVLFPSSAALVKILHSASIATNWDSPMFENGAWGAGFCRA